MPGPLAAALLFLVIVVPLLIFSIPLLAIWTYHRRKMEELRARRDIHTSEAIQAEFAAIRAEIQSLRDTSMQYDLSFDTSLQQLERRVMQIERQERSAWPTTDEAARNTLYPGR